MRETRQPTTPSNTRAHPMSSWMACATMKMGSTTKNCMSLARYHDQPSVCLRISTKLLMNNRLYHHWGAVWLMTFSYMYHWGPSAKYGESWRYTRMTNMYTGKILMKRWIYNIGQLTPRMPFLATSLIRPYAPRNPLIQKKVSTEKGACVMMRKLKRLSRSGKVYAMLEKPSCTRPIYVCPRITHSMLITRMPLRVVRLPVSGENRRWKLWGREKLFATECQYSPMRGTVEKLSTLAALPLPALPSLPTAAVPSLSTSSAGSSFSTTFISRPFSAENSCPLAMECELVKGIRSTVAYGEAYMLPSTAAAMKKMHTPMVAQAPNDRDPSECSSAHTTRVI
mmetsp:Transcript_22396/g.56193  ORF Transcript_22396/g.56193 Transcript_22396/m.56193 type:complete len:339 (-) Transcript_22396:342-1358(-)